MPKAKSKSAARAGKPRPGVCAAAGVKKAPRMKVACCKCKAATETEVGRSGEPNVPRGGWRHHGGGFWCKECWEKNFCPRTARIALNLPQGDLRRPFLDALRTAFRQTTRVANWAMRECVRRDVQTAWDAAKLPTLPAKWDYLYPGARKFCGPMDTNSINILTRDIAKKYKEARFRCTHTHQASVPSFKKEFPYPLKANTYSIERTKDGAVTLAFKLGGTRWVATFRGGDEFRRQMSMIAQLLRGEAVQGDARLSWKNVPLNGNRSGVTGRAAGGGMRKGRRLMANISVWLPKKVGPRERSGTLEITTLADAFLTYCTKGHDRPYTLHARHVRRWIAEHRERLDCMSDDRKCETRRVVVPPGLSKTATARERKQAKRHRYRKRQQYRDRLSEWTWKQDNRLTSFIHETTNMLANAAVRYCVASVHIDHTERSYLDSFPYFKFVEALRYKLDAWNIPLTEVKPSDIEEEESVEIEEGQSGEATVSPAPEQHPAAPARQRAGTNGRKMASAAFALPPTNGAGAHVNGKAKR